MSVNNNNGLPGDYSHLDDQALDVIKRGLADPNVRSGRRLSLIQRAKRILASPGNQKKRKVNVEDFGDLQLVEPNAFGAFWSSAPLDIFCDWFYETRKAHFEKQLEKIRAASVEQLQELLAESWCEHEGQLCVGVNWDRFTGIDQAKQLVSCFGGEFLAGVFAIFAKGYRYRLSGIPDLVVWNPCSLEYKIIEVKGPGDRLSTKQQVWLDELDSLGARAEVCYVTVVGAKRLKVS